MNGFTRRTKVFRIIARLNVGGPAIHTILLTRSLDPHRFESTLAVGRPGPDEADMSYLATAEGVEPLVIPTLGRSLRAWDDLSALKDLLRQLLAARPDVVHTHTAKAGTLGRLAAVLTRVPVRIHTFHGHVFQGYFGPLQTQLFLAIERLLARVTDRIIVLSEQQRHELVNRYRIARPEQVVVVPLGLDLRPLAKRVAAERATGRHALRAELGIPVGAPLVGVVGRIVPVKDHALFLDGAAQLLRLPDAPTDVHFVIVGGGDDAMVAALRRRATELGIADRVRWAGWRRDLAAIYSELDVVALTSLNEGTPVAVIEALASGTPVVATAVGGVGDVLEHGRFGALIHERTGDAVARALSETMGGLDAARQRAALGQAAVLERYSIERLCADLASLYERELLRKGRPGAAAAAVDEAATSSPSTPTPSGPTERVLHAAGGQT
jgi:glycosyltransferase involved in cell wall biosynthesis